MAVQVETLDKLERRITLTLPAADDRVGGRVAPAPLSRTVNADGFRPGKVPMSVVSQRYGYSVAQRGAERQGRPGVLEAVNEAKLRVAGPPRITEKAEAPEGEVAFDATFEVYPEVKLGDLSQAEVERVTTEVGDEAVDKTIEILRKQRRTFQQRPASEGAAPRATGSRSISPARSTACRSRAARPRASSSCIGEGQMLRQFDSAVRGMKAGDSKTFPLQFPADYQGKDVAGKEADFTVTLKKIEAQHLPAVDESLAKALGIAGGTVEALRADVRKNLEREVKFRVQARNKASVMDALVKSAELEVPKSLVAGETERMVEQMRADLKKRGMKDAETAPIPAEMFQPQAERRVRLGLVVAELVAARTCRPSPSSCRRTSRSSRRATRSRAR